MEALRRPPAVLVLEDGRIFRGEAYGAIASTTGEAVFNTGMTGYQETLTDPSYHRQVVVMTSPHIGNTGINDEDQESRQIWVAGFVVRDPAIRASNWRSRRDLEDELREQGIVGICHIDTRALTRHLRNEGAMRVGVFSGEAATRPEAELLDEVRSSPQMVGAALVDEVTTGETLERFDAPGPDAGLGEATDRVPLDREPDYVIALVDLGIKEQSIRQFNARGVKVFVLAADSSIDDIMAVAGVHATEGPDGVFFSNGPGDPSTAETQIDLLREVLRRRIPFFGICFGNQLLGRALGFDTYKLQFGHRGINQPVLVKATGLVDITAHNHGFAVDAPIDRDVTAPLDRMPEDQGGGTEIGRVRVSHICLNDDVVEGLQCLDSPAFSVQFHPEAAAGPHDSQYIFDDFVALMAATHGVTDTATSASSESGERGQA
ncbi:MAG: glutamine-hydrolyzing carbamoyl-phosphate synthase small subunit [Dermatophilus congolensis]|nr:glutamine-hydrolyzing carbamoyl-phosphate synthase small subunit [Dermatophilus congolensis]